MLFDENQQHSNPSKSMSSMTNQNTREPLSLFFDAQESIVSSSTLFGAPTSSLHPYGSLAIVVSSLGNFRTLLASLLHDCLQILGHNITHLNPPLHDNRTGSSLNLQSQPHDCSTDTNPGPNQNHPNPKSTNLHETNNTHQRTHNMTTRSMNQILKPKQIHTVSKYPIPHTIEPMSVSQAISQPHWCEAISNELTALTKHGTWDLILPPSNCKLVGCKWVF